AAGHGGKRCVSGSGRGGRGQRRHPPDSAGHVARVWVHGDHRRLGGPAQPVGRDPRGGAVRRTAERRIRHSDGGRARRDRLHDPGLSAFPGARQRTPPTPGAAAPGPVADAGGPPGRTMNQDQIVALLAVTVVTGTPLIFAAIGVLLAERSGVLNLGVEGMMLVGAVSGFAVAAVTATPRPAPSGLRGGPGDGRCDGRRRYGDAVWSGLRGRSPGRTGRRVPFPCLHTGVDGKYDRGSGLDRDRAGHFLDVEPAAPSRWRIPFWRRGCSGVSRAVTGGGDLVDLAADAPLPLHPGRAGPDQRATTAQSGPARAGAPVLPRRMR